MDHELYNILDMYDATQYLQWFAEASIEEINEEYETISQQLFLIRQVITALYEDFDEADLRRSIEIMKILSYDCPDDIKKLFIEDIIEENT